VYFRCPGAGVELDGVYVWDGVKIGDGCKIKRAIIASNAELKEKVVIMNDVLVGHDVVIGPDYTAPAHSRFALTVDEDHGDEPCGGSIGEQGKGVRLEVDEEDPDYNFLIWAAPGELDSDSESSDGSDDGNDDGDLLAQQSTAIDPYDMFYEEVLDVVRERVRKVKTFSKEVLSNVALEVSGSRSAHHMSPEESAKAICQAIVATGQSDADYLKKAFACLAPILKNYAKSQAAQQDLILNIEGAILMNPQAAPAFPLILQ
jgi:translation initiation factor eIF-2B subunit epsilon